MKGDPRVLKALNDVLRKELTGINQYFLHSRMCRNWGYQILDDAIFRESVEEMQHADQIINRILLLNGVPNVAGYDKIIVGKTVQEQLGKRPRAGRGGHHRAPRRHCHMP